METRNVQPVADLVDEPGEIEARANAADRAGQDVVEHERGNGELGKRSAHRLVHNFVDTSSHEHAAALNVDSFYGVREQHDAEDEPRGRLADLGFRDAARIVRGGGEIAQDDGGCSPERDKREHDGGSDHHLRHGRALEGNLVSQWERPFVDVTFFKSNSFNLA